MKTKTRAIYENAKLFFQRRTTWDKKEVIQQSQRKRRVFLMLHWRSWTKLKKSKVKRTNQRHCLLKVEAVKITKHFRTFQETKPKVSVYFVQWSTWSKNVLLRVSRATRAQFWGIKKIWWFCLQLLPQAQHDILVTNITFISGTTEKWRKATESVSLLTARYHYNIIIYHTGSIFRPRLSKNGITSYSKLLLTFPSLSPQSCRFLLIRADPA